MMDHVLDWLQAYHDGELQERQVRRVEEHLARCEACRAELEALRTFSSFLQESPAADALMPSEQFVAQVGLLLPRRPERTPLQRALETGWRLIPVGLFGAWAFVQALFVVATGVLVAQSIPGSADLLSPIVASTPGGSWLTGLHCFTGVGLNDLFEAALCVVGYIGSLEWSVALSTVLLAGIGLLYWGWLASWWIHRQRQSART